MTRILTPTQEADLIDAYLSGANQAALGRRFGVSRPVVARVLRAHSVPLQTRGEVQQRLARGRTPERRRAMVAKANESRRGRRETEARKSARARTRQARGLGISPSEILLAQWLSERGVEVTPQVAVGPYNADIGASPVAVEVFGGGWHDCTRHALTFPDRCRYFLNQD